MLKQSSQRLANVILAEDSLSDIELFKAYMDIGNIQFNLKYVRNGEEFCDYVLDIKDKNDPNFPDLVFLDLNLPKISGQEILVFLKKSKLFNKVPAIVLSGSDNNVDISSSMKKGALDYLVKPLNFDKLKPVIKKVKEIDLLEEDNNIKLYRRN